MQRLVPEFVGGDEQDAHGARVRRVHRIAEGR